VRYASGGVILKRKETMELKKELRLLDVFCIATGAMISSGLFILPGLAYLRAGPAVVLSYLVAGLLAMTGMLSQAELVSAMPKAGGTYFYITRAMGPAVGTVDGLVTWFSLSLKSALALVGMAAFVALIADVNMQLITVGLVVLFILLNLLGIKEAGRAQVGLVIALIIILAVYIIRGLPAVRVQAFEPFATHGIGAIFYTAGFVFVSYGGLLKVASVAEEVRDPARVIPLGMILSLLVTTILYMLVVFVTAGVLPADQLGRSLTPISDGARVFMGQWGMIVLGIAAILAFISTANAGIMASSRYPLALSRDGLLPEHLQRVNKRFKTPHVAIILTGVLMILVMFLKLDSLVKVASTVLIMTYLFSCLSTIVLRESRLQNYQPRFKTPLYPVLQIVGIGGFGFILFKMGGAALMASSFMIVGGLFVYWFYGRIRTSREFALIYLIERVTARELTTRSLETELKEIIQERDEISKDRFDHVVEECVVLDIDMAISMEDFFQLVADRMSARLGFEPDTYYRHLIERENESTTVLSPHLAIPHMVIEGEHKFDILLARCRPGIKFPGIGHDVHAVFVLAGTRDERPFHLRSLAAIAQIVQDPHFEERWMAARNKEDLRDVILLCERRRQ
jgi:amino acid transporter/mannitol/fructose-specific phosphotransferase system IIA component (Ntr-type)